MLKEGNFGIFEAIWLISLSCCTKILLAYPRTVVELGGSAGWIIPLISGVSGFLGMVIIVLLLKRFPGQTIVEAGNSAAGPMIGSIAALLYAAFFIFSAAMVLREFCESIKIMSLPMTPFYVIIVSFMLVSAVSAYLGIEALSRMAIIIALSMFVIIVLIVALTMNKYNINYIFPLLGKGPKTLLLWGMIKSSNFSELLFAGLIVNSIGGYKHVFKTTSISIMISTLLSSLITACIIMTFNVSMTEEFLLPLFRLTKEISIGRFFQRAESIFELSWTTVGLLYCAVGLYSSSAIFARMFKMKSFKPFVPVFAVIIFFLALLPHDIKAAFIMDNDVLRRYSWIVSFGVPLLLLLLIAIVRKKKVKPKCAKGV